VYVSNVGAPGPGTPPACSVSVIAGASNAVVKTLPAGDEPTAFCYSANDRRVYWVNEWSHSIAGVDAATDTQVALVPLAAGGTQVQPVDIAYNSANGRVYTANRLTFEVGVLATVPVGCTADLDGSGAVDGADLGALLNGWGSPGTTDLDGSGTTDGADLGSLLAGWGPC
jgi:DNA-binding beta-propeller fold protein YncE